MFLLFIVTVDCVSFCCYLIFHSFSSGHWILYFIVSVCHFLLLIYKLDWSFVQYRADY